MNKGILFGGGAVLLLLIAGAVYTIFQPPDNETLIGRAMVDYRNEQVRAAAETGDPWAMKMLYLIGETSTGRKDKKRALELMSRSDSPTAQYFYYRRTHRKKYLQSREGMLARARFTRENLRMPTQTDKEYARQTFIFEASLDSLSANAARGDSDAQWVLSELEKDDETFARKR